MAKQFRQSRQFDLIFARVFGQVNTEITKRTRKIYYTRPVGPISTLFCHNGPVRQPRITVIVIWRRRFVEMLPFLQREMRPLVCHLSLHTRLIFVISATFKDSWNNSWEWCCQKEFYSFKKRTIWRVQIAFTCNWTDKLSTIRHFTAFNMKYVLIYFQSDSLRNLLECNSQRDGLSALIQTESAINEHFWWIIWTCVLNTKFVTIRLENMIN